MKKTTISLLMTILMTSQAHAAIAIAKKGAPVQVKAAPAAAKPAAAAPVVQPVSIPDDTDGEDIQAPVVTKPVATIKPMTAERSPASIHCGKRDTVGIVAGGALGGLLGHQVGKGKGNTLMTIGGALVGDVAGAAVANQTDDNCVVGASDENR